jgi:hypothetical protein
MASNFHRADAAVNAEVAAVVALLNGGKLLIYSGAQPANADAATGAGTLLAQLTFNATALSGSPSAGVGTFAAITQDSSANATGTAAWFRATKADDTPVFDGTVEATGGTADCIINSIAISSGAAVSVSAMTYTANKG